MKRKIFRIPILLAFLIGIAFTGYKVYSIASEYYLGEKLYSDVQRYAVLPTQSASSDPEMTGANADATSPTEQSDVTAPTEDTTVYPEVDFAALQQINGDVVAWIYIEGTDINYPVVQGEDNRYYVSTLLDGTYNGAGSIFLDYHNAPDFSDIHSVLYGHNMNNGTMFHDICSYQTQEFYEEHPTGLLVTPEKNFRFEIVSAYVSSLADPSWQLEFVDDDDAFQWLTDSMDRSLFTSHTQPQPGDQMITLSTCSYEFNDARFVLVGVLKESGKY